ncbi:MAG TPA: helix-turn-helix domain-containing protein [Ktedonobacteraceae bacterium]|nr:helix-turn-helix domain-containing protein [Ktedonobacteraceae bacterium]
MPDPEDRLIALEKQVADLRMRLTLLEERLPRSTPGLPPLPALPALPSSPADHELFQERETFQGVLSCEGSVQFAEQDVHWRRRLALQSIFAASPELLAQLFAALSSPHRVIILRTLCEGPRTSQQLQELLGMGSAGQLYHHLKELLATGLILQRGRSAYTIEPTKVIPVCIALMMAFCLTTPDQSTQANMPPNREEELFDSD